MLTFEESSTSSIAAEVLHKKARLDESESDDDDDPTVESEVSIPAAVEILSMLHKKRLYAESKDNVKDEVPFPFEL